MNNGFVVSTSVGLNAMASADYEVVTAFVTRTQCLSMWRADPTSYFYLHDTVDPAAVVAAPAAVPPDIRSVPRGTIYVVQAHVAPRFNSDLPPGSTAHAHQSEQRFHGTVMPNGVTLLFVSCAAGNAD